MNWLFLRGLSREQRHWGTFPDVFSAHIPDARIHCLDLPGTGTEVRRPSPLTVRAIAEDLRGRWTALAHAHSGPWGLLAMSLGGMVAMQWAADHRADFARVVLVNTSASDLSRPWERLDFRALGVIARALATDDPVARERLVLSITARLHTDVEPTAVRWAAIQAESPVTRATVLRQIWAASRFRAPPRIEVPVLIVGGGRDPLANPSCARRLALHFGAPLEVHPDAGHEMALDTPDWLAARIAGWLAPA